LEERVSTEPVDGNLHIVDNTLHNVRHTLHGDMMIDIKKQLRFILLMIFVITFQTFLSIGQPILAIITISVGIVIFVVISYKSNMQKTDERSDMIQGRAAYLTLRITFGVLLSAFLFFWILDINKYIFYTLFIISGIMTVTYATLLLKYQWQYGELH